MLTATNIDAPTAALIEKLPENTVLISINEEHENAYYLQLNRKSPDILTVRFSDVTAPRPYGDKHYLPISNATALDIIGFIEKNKDKNFLIHCQAGISRSSAICIYLNIKYGHKLKENFWMVSNPNKFVVGSLIINSL
jgi:predicted protein tyrosine phosphatase